MWAQACREVARQFPKIQFEEVIVDNACMQLVSKPEQFDVMVSSSAALLRVPCCACRAARAVLRVPCCACCACARAVLRAPLRRCACWRAALVRPAPRPALHAAPIAVLCCVLPARPCAVLHAVPYTVRMPCCLCCVCRPLQVTPNLYGNLVSNIVAGLCGGFGVVPGGARRRHGTPGDVRLCGPGLALWRPSYAP